MNAPASLPRDIDPAILQEAAEWMMRLTSGEAGAAEHEALARWQAQSSQHRLAWQRAEAFLADLRRMPAEVAKTALDRPPARRRALARLVWLPLAPTAAWLGWRHAWPAMLAELRTATGEQRQVTLADGTLLTLNTSTAVDIRYSSQQRLIRLIEGEVLIATATDPAPLTPSQPRPFLVQTVEGTARALGTRFTVRRLQGTGTERSRVVVFEGAVGISAGGRHLVLDRGRQAEFTTTAIGPAAPASEAVDGAWASGMLIARQIRLADLAAELDRYRPGLLRCHPGVADLRISGAFPLLDPERSLRLLTDTFPLRLRYRTRYWATLESNEG
ncbi:FecR domain-containing protein [Thauera chlorobenzoica]|uniref:Fe2+-dicitrate sensor, membrane component n=1 Tax=Thauera chlorobenzoica TaxID=96773 RepID=A0A1H5VW70_9RHOO|nr:FecR domain-containing protein [Thauera chlorobenzoica]APR03955.1 Fe2+-dicitrate sensor, membrane component [Thauera chlorobenzoica]SEF91236.1 FecR family protein [Thauera chlorobenzoica]